MDPSPSPEGGGGSSKRLRQNVRVMVGLLHFLGPTVGGHIFLVLQGARLVKDNYPLDLSLVRRKSISAWIIMTANLPAISIGWCKDCVK